MILESSKVRRIISIPRTEYDASQLLSFDSSESGVSNMLGEVEIKPGHQEKMVLGEFHSDQEVSGFSLNIHPSQDDGMIVAKLVQLKHDESDLDEFILHLANYSGVTVSVEIREL